MAFSQTMLEQIVSWCSDSTELTAPRRDARSVFFGEDDERPVKYWEGAGDFTSKERRFLGYFLFDYRLPSGESPAEVAVQRTFKGAGQAEALNAVRHVRFVFAEIAGIAGRSVNLRVETERFEVRNAQLAATLRRDFVITAHLVPVRHGYWLAGPGWLSLPLTLGPGARSNLSQIQLDPISVERFLQGRARPPGEEPPAPLPMDQDLEAAVSRMSAWAKDRGYDPFVMSPEEWRGLVIKHFNNPAVMAFYQEVAGRIDAFASPEDVQDFSGLLMNIWNNTPQPDRGGLTANQLLGIEREARN